MVPLASISHSHLLVFIFSAPAQGKTVFLNQGYGLVGRDDPRQIVEIEYKKTSGREILVDSLKRPAQILDVYDIIEAVLETDRQVDRALKLSGCRDPA